MKYYIFSLHASYNKIFLSDEDCVSSILKIKENIKKVLFIEIQKPVVVFSKYL